MTRRLARPLIAVLATLATAAAGLAATVALATPAVAANPVTPGHFTGYGFDQCIAPDQHAMDRWLTHSQFLAVGIYISGESRGCREQPNLTPTWVSTQLRRGWRLLPITLGPQSSCHPGFPRYRDDETIRPWPGRNGRYKWARRQGRTEARTSVQAAQALGIPAGSTLWYDLEGFDTSRTRCRESALRFLHTWNREIRHLGYVSGFYSSAASGISMLDNARVNRPGTFRMPDRIWIADWDGRANTSSAYVRADGWRPGRRMKQYRGGHTERHGGVTINIDSNFLDLGKGSVPHRRRFACGTRIDFDRYVRLQPDRVDRDQLKALQCLLRQAGYYRGRVHGRYNARTTRAVEAFQTEHDTRVRPAWIRSNWMALFALGPKPVLKFGSTGAEVRRVQRALNAAGNPRLDITGHFDRSTRRALIDYQRRVGGVPATGIVAGTRWRMLANGIRR